MTTPVSATTSFQFIRSNDQLPEPVRYLAQRVHKAMVERGSISKDAKVGELLTRMRLFIVEGTRVVDFEKVDVDCSTLFNSCGFYEEDVQNYAALSGYRVHFVDSSNQKRRIGMSSLGEPSVSRFEHDRIGEVISSLR